MQVSGSVKIVHDSLDWRIERHGSGKFEPYTYALDYKEFSGEYYGGERVVCFVNVGWYDTEREAFREIHKQITGFYPAI